MNSDNWGLNQNMELENILTNKYCKTDDYSGLKFSSFLSYLHCFHILDRPHYRNYYIILKRKKLWTCVFFEQYVYSNRYYIELVQVTNTYLYRGLKFPKFSFLKTTGNLRNNGTIPVNCLTLPTLGILRDFRQ